MAKLRDRAAKAAKRAKRKAKQAVSRKEQVDISPVGDQYLVIDSAKNETYGPFDDRKQAAGKYRELVGSDAVSKGSGGGAAAKFAKSVDKKLENFATPPEDGEEPQRGPAADPFGGAFGPSDDGGGQAINPPSPGGFFDGAAPQSEDTQANPGPMINPPDPGVPAGFAGPSNTDLPARTPGESAEERDPLGPILGRTGDQAEQPPEPAPPMMGQEPQAPQFDFSGFEGDQGSEPESKDRYPWMF